MFEVQNFEYNGFYVNTLLGKTLYKVTPVKWTNDPGIIECKCSDGKKRLIPTCQIYGFNNYDFPKQVYENKVLFGIPCNS